MAKVTSKYQVSIPKTLATQLRLKPGDDIEWGLAGEELRIIPSRPRRALTAEERLELFDLATRRQTSRNKRRSVRGAKPSRGWKREDLYDRGRTR